VGGLTIATFMAGFLIIGMGLARLGNWLRYIPHPLIVGFTTGRIDYFSAQKDFVCRWRQPADLSPNGSPMGMSGISTVCNLIAGYSTHVFTFTASPRIPGAIVACTTLCRVFSAYTRKTQKAV
jgi:hypothetical protein